MQACPIRLRPILMTSMATIAGAIPPALAMGAGAETQRPMAIALIGGMVVSTLLTLFVVPAAYSLLDDVVEWNTPAASPRPGPGLRPGRGLGWRARAPRGPGRRAPAGADRSLRTDALEDRSRVPPNQESLARRNRLVFTRLVRS